MGCLKFNFVHVDKLDELIPTHTNSYELVTHKVGASRQSPLRSPNASAYLPQIALTMYVETNVTGDPTGERFSEANLTRFVYPDFKHRTVYDGWALRRRRRSSLSSK